MSRPYAAPIALAILTLASAGAASAADTDADWVRFGRDVDPNAFVVGHPASPRWAVRHAGGEHPAVIVARRAAERPDAIDPNTFLVQPPAAVAWREQDETATTVAARTDVVRR